MNARELIQALSALAPETEIAICAHEDGRGEDCLEPVTFDVEPGVEPLIDDKFYILHPARALVCADSIEP